MLWTGSISSRLGSIARRQCGKEQIEKALLRHVENMLK
jgi:hypothetical protein